MYSGWHFSADAEGCDSLLELLDGLATAGTANHRTLAVVHPGSVGVDRIFGDHALKVHHPAKLRLAFDSATPEADLVETSDRVTLTMGADGLKAFREAISDLRAGEADFGISLADDDSLSFWWWPK
ncbi:MAG: hypothetical protein V4707_13840 [Pseudomonadota bacterium]